MAPHKVYVSTATGTQGGAVARQLRALGWEVSTTTRDANSAAAQALASIGVDVHQGDWTNDAALEAAITGSDLLFLNMMPDLTNPDNESKHGKNVLRIAEAAGVTHVVYSGVMSQPGRDAHPFGKAFAAKHVLEQEVQRFPRWTILRPGFFVTNFLAPKVQLLYPGTAETGLFVLALRPDTELALIDHEDIGAFAVAAFQDPERFHGQKIELASESVTIERVIETIRRVTGLNIRAKYLSNDEVEEVRAANPLIALQEILRDGSTAGHAEAAKGWGVPTTTFEAFVERDKKAFEETYRNIAA